MISAAEICFWPLFIYPKFSFASVAWDNCKVIHLKYLSETLHFNILHKKINAKKSLSISQTSEDLTSAAVKRFDWQSPP